MELAWTEAQALYYINPLGWNLTLGVGLLLTGYVLPSWRTTKWGQDRMARQARTQSVEAQAIEDFVHSVEERVASGDYTREEAKELYRKAKKAWPSSDLYPSTELLKEAIDKRMTSGDHAPVQLPDPKPRAKMFSGKRTTMPAKA